MLAVYKREMRAYFTSPIAYIYLAVFCLITGYVFCLANLMSATTSFSSVFSVVFTVMMVLLPLLTMRLMADEKKQKTDQGLLTAPVSLSGIVCGKFFAALTVFALGMIIYICYAIVLKSLAGSIPVAEFVGNMVGLLLLGGAFISIGIFVSSLTELQIVAAIGSFIINLLLYICDLIASNMQWEPLKAALDAGADILNDVSALEDDPDCADLASSTGIPVILMHKKTLELMKSSR